MLYGDNRFKTNIATNITKAIANTQYLGGALSGGVSQFANPKWDAFQGVGVNRRQALLTHSVSGSLLNTNNRGYYGAAFGGRYNSFSNALYHTLDAQKANRIYQYRLMSAFPQVAQCVDKIADNFFWQDQRGHIVNFKYRDQDLPQQFLKDLEHEFQVFVNHFDLKYNGRRLAKDYIVDGQVYYQLIIDSNNKERGILGVQRLQTELIQAVYKNKTTQVIGAFLGRNIVYDDKIKHQISSNTVPYHPNEIFHVNSGNWDPSGEWIIPYIERARKRYVQLSYLEDAIVIYRLVRAPQRLIFDIDTGNMPPPDAQAYIRDVQQQYWRSKTFNIDTGDIMHKFEPQSMLDAFFLVRSGGADSVKISQLSGGQNLGQLDDLNFFLKAIYRAMRIPVSYLTDNATASVDPSSILRDELQFAKIIIEQQKRFARQLIRTFIIHLKLTGKYKQYNLKQTAFQAVFCPPSNYYELRRKQAVQLDAAAFNAIVANDCISKSWAMKRVWGLTNAEIKQNQRLRLIDAMNQWKVQQAKANGPFWRTAAAMAVGAGQMAQSQGGGDFGDDFGGADFGGDFGDDFGGDDFQQTPQMQGSSNEQAIQDIQGAIDSL